MIRQPIGNHQSKIGNVLAEAAGVEPAHAMRGDLANRCHTIRRRLRKTALLDIAGGSDILAEGEGVEPSRLLLGLVFKTSCAPPRATFQIWLGRPDLNRESRVWNPMVCRLAYAPRKLGACGRTRTHEGQSSPPDFEGGCLCCSATHAKRNFRSQIPDSKIKK